MGGIIFNLFGFLYLWIKYRNKEKVEEVLINKYDNRYFNAGAQLSLSIIGIILITVLIILLLTIIARLIYDLFQ